MLLAAITDSPPLAICAIVYVIILIATVYAQAWRFAIPMAALLVAVGYFMPSL